MSIPDKKVRSEVSADCYVDSVIALSLEKSTKINPLLEADRHREGFVPRSRPGACRSRAVARRLPFEVIIVISPPEDICCLLLRHYYFESVLFVKIFLYI